MTAFYSDDERALGEDFAQHGYVIREATDRAALDRIRAEIVRLAVAHLKCAAPNDAGVFLERIHEMVKPADLNALRLAVFGGLNANDWLRATYFAVARRHLERLVGNELAMQNRVNLSVQMPDDDSSTLPIHADTFGGESPFQVVVWLPLVDSRGTQSMFILPRAKNTELLPTLRAFADKGGMAGLYAHVEPELVWLDVPYGSALVFSTNQLHGNVINRERTTRWSLNCRFKGLFTPYTSEEKSLGAFYRPITMRPVTRIGLDYEPPGGFEE